MVRPQFFLTESPSDDEWESRADEDNEEKHAKLRCLPGDSYTAPPGGNRRQADQYDINSAYDYPDLGLISWVISSDG
jgi:hypothetical protein